MDYRVLSGELQALIKGRVSSSEPMSKHTTWRIGGPADLFVNPIGQEDLYKAVEFARKRDIPHFVIGNGSNLLVKDGGVRGMVIKLGRGLAEISVSGNSIKAGAGAMLPELAATARKAGIGGFEFAAGIPGSLGGAVVMNAGALNGCVADVLTSITVLDEHSNFSSMTKEELGFSYRKSVMHRLPLICVETNWSGTYKDKALIEEETKDYLAKRKAAQPQGFPNAGSVFKNPEGDSAGRLIEAAGGKGLRVGDAEIATKHANWILNLGNASAKDVLILIEKARKLVEEKFGISLQREVKLLGED